MFKKTVIIFLCNFTIFATAQNSTEDVVNSISQIVSGMVFTPVTPIDTVPESNVKFYLYQRNNKDTPTEIFINNTSAVNKTKLTKFVTHGYTHNAFLQQFIDIKNSYLARGDYNVILVDWSKLALQLYRASADATKGVGNRIGELIVQSQIDPKNIVLSGHSLGAHVMGFAGKYVFNATGQKIERINGIDPAGPKFENATSNNSLAKTDAQSVSVLHTDAGLFGITRSVGTIDFYFNGGSSVQPGCFNYFPFIPILSSYLGAYCSHMISLNFFNESINLNNFVGTLCSSKEKYNLGLCSGNQRAVLSESTPLSTTGVYYLNTNPKYPYGQG